MRQSERERRLALLAGRTRSGLGISVEVLRVVVRRAVAAGAVPVPPVARVVPADVVAAARLPDEARTGERFVAAWFAFAGFFAGPFFPFGAARFGVDRAFFGSVGAAFFAAAFFAGFFAPFAGDFFAEPFGFVRASFVDDAFLVAMAELREVAHQARLTALAQKRGPPPRGRA